MAGNFLAIVRVLCYFPTHQRLRTRRRKLPATISHFRQRPKGQGSDRVVTG